MNSVKERLPFLLEGYLAAFALANIGGIATTNIITLVLFLLCFQFFKYSAGRERECALSEDGKKLVHGRSAGKRRTAALVLGIFYTFCYVAAAHGELTGTLENGLFRLIYLGLTAAGLFLLFFRGCGFLFLLLEKRSERIRRIVEGNAKKAGTGQADGVKNSGQPFWLIFLLLLACWFPWFLYDFPGVMTPDSLSQFSQAGGLIGYSNHHPFVHTLLIQLFTSLGNAVFHDVYAGIACYTVFQMIAMALIVTYGLQVLFRRGAGKKLCFCFLLFYALVPYNGIFAVTMWKDILFSGLFLLFVLSVYQLLPLCCEGRRFGERPGLLVLFGISGVLVCLMRSNGLYAFVFSMPFLVYAFRRHWKIILPLQVLVLAVVFLVKGPVMEAFDVAQPAFSESLSIPAQQIARVVYEGRELSGEQKELLGKTVEYSAIADYYQPELSDPVKALIQYGHPEYLEAHKGEYLRLWVQLGLKYPLDYWNAFVDQTKGYWFPDAPGLLTNEGISPNELGLSWQPVLRGQAVTKIVEILSKLYTIFPLYGLLYSIGAFTWAAVFLFANCLLNGKKENWILYLPFFAILLTLCAATPVASDVRYAYSLILSMPLLIHAGLEIAGPLPGANAKKADRKENSRKKSPFQKISVPKK